jgi:Cu(I)/Ag(I) efflux system membrane fusion protein
VVFVDPVVEETARTVQVRIELPNRNGVLRPSMFANVTLSHPMGEALLVPTSAVIRTGDRNVVYRVENDQFIPVEVAIAPEQFGDRYRVLKGLAVDDVVVTSANFLIDSESRLRASGGNMAGMPGM